MTNEDAIEMLDAKRECIKREASGTDIDCIDNKCNECELNYAQGNMGEQLEALEMAIKALEQTKAKGEWKDIYAESEGSNSWIEFSCPHCGNTFGIESGQYGWSYGDAIPWKACPMCGGLAEHEPYKAESEEEE